MSDSRLKIHEADVARRADVPDFEKYADLRIREVRLLVLEDDYRVATRDVSNFTIALVLLTVLLPLALMSQRDLNNWPLLISAVCCHVMLLAVYYVAVARTIRKCNGIQTQITEIVDELNQIVPGGRKHQHRQRKLEQNLHLSYGLFIVAVLLWAVTVAQAKGWVT